MHSISTAGSLLWTFLPYWLQLLFLINRTALPLTRRYVPTLSSRRGPIVSLKEPSIRIPDKKGRRTAFPNLSKDPAKWPSQTRGLSPIGDWGRENGFKLISPSGTMCPAWVSCPPPSSDGGIKEFIDSLRKAHRLPFVASLSRPAPRFQRSPHTTPQPWPTLLPSPYPAPPSP